MTGRAQAIFCFLRFSELVIVMVMEKIKRVEDLEVFKLFHSLVKDIYLELREKREIVIKMLSNLPKSLSKKSL